MKIKIQVTILTLLLSLRTVWSQTIANPSGSLELDQIRLDIKSKPTNRETFQLRAIRNGDGTTNEIFKYQMGNKVEESCTALYKEKAYIMSSDGYVHAI
ncbi:MAG: hypothetical protein JXQ96_23105 [Cyclobacteriaceae bacterium]